MEWLDGGWLRSDKIGSRITAVLFPVSSDGVAGDRGWRTFRGQMVFLEGVSSEMECSSVTIYHWLLTGVDQQSHAFLQRCDNSKIFSNHAGDQKGLKKFISVCSGMGGGVMGVEMAGFDTILACDKSPLAVKVLSRNARFPVICGDIADVDVVATLHQHKGDLCPWLEGGFPCQPFSRLGDERHFDDSRAWTFVALLKASWLLQTRGLLLECVDGVLNCQPVQAFLRDLCEVNGFKSLQVVMHLDRFWASRRTRWWCVMLPKEWSADCLLDLPVGSQGLTVEQVLPEIPQWDLDDELKLRWTELELSCFKDPSFGNVNRRLVQSSKAPCVLHSLGSQLYDCPCGCRGPLSSDRLKAAGLFGIEVVSSWPEHHLRHPHPFEVGALVGVSAGYQYGSDLRGALALLGQIASPFQSMWAGLQLRNFVSRHANSSVFDQLSLGDLKALLHHHADFILAEKHSFWPPTDRTQNGRCKIHALGQEGFEFRFQGGSRIQDFVDAQAKLDHTEKWKMFFQGIELRPTDFLKSSTYDCARVPTCLNNDEGSVVVDFVSDGVRIQIECLSFSFLFQFAAKAGIDTSEFVAFDFDTRRLVMWDTRIEQSTAFGIDRMIRGGGSKATAVLQTVLSNQQLQAWHRQCHANGNAPSLDEGLDEVVMNCAALSILKQSGNKNVCFFGPRAAAAWLKAGDLAGQWVRQELQSFDGDRVMVLFGDDYHWALVDYQILDSFAEITYVDGIEERLEKQAEFIGHLIHANFGFGPVDVTKASGYCQQDGQTCGAVALLHMGWRLALWESFTEDDVNTWYQRLRWGHDSCIMKGGGHGSAQVSDQLHSVLGELLQAKGVPEKLVSERIQQAVQKFGVAKLEQAMKTRNQWQALKSLGSSLPKPFMWVRWEELQQHIATKGAEQFGAKLDDNRKMGKKKGKQPFVPHGKVIDPELLALPTGFFHDGSNEVHQLPFAQVKSGASGVAFCKIEDAMPFVAETKSISTSPLMLLTVGEMEGSGTAPHIKAVEVPARYLGTNEPILLRCTSVQLGDIPVLEKKGTCPEVATMPTAVVKVHWFRDACDTPWDDIVARPIKSLISACAPLQVCRTPKCDASCGLFHPSVEEDGVSTVLIDLWGWLWSSNEGKKSAPAEATQFQLFFRCPESASTALHAWQGQSGLFFEPRKADGVGTDAKFRVIWIPGANLKQVVHMMNTIDEVEGVARIQNRHGIRCLAKHAEILHKQFCPDRPFFDVECTHRFRLEPLPVGSQMQGIVEVLKAWKWNARPIQQIRGSQGKAWEIASSGPPPCDFFRAKHGLITAVLLKEVASSKQSNDQVIATAKTRKHISEAGSVVGGNDQPDPWANWLAAQRRQLETRHMMTKESASSKLEDLGQKLKADMLE